MIRVCNDPLPHWRNPPAVDGFECCREYSCQPKRSAGKPLQLATQDSLQKQDSLPRKNAEEDLKPPVMGIMNVLNTIQDVRTIHPCIKELPECRWDPGPVSDYSRLLTDEGKVPFERFSALCLTFGIWNVPITSPVSLQGRSGRVQRTSDNELSGISNIFLIAIART